MPVHWYAPSRRQLGPRPFWLFTGGTQSISDGSRANPLVPLSSFSVATMSEIGKFSKVMTKFVAGQQAMMENLERVLRAAISPGEASGGTELRGAAKRLLDQKAMHLQSFTGDAAQWYD